MSAARIIDGKAMAATIRGHIAAEAARLRDHGLVPGLAVILIGDDPASHVYVSGKLKACEKAGFSSFEHRLPSSASHRQVLGLIDRLNKSPQVHGILLQLPLPEQLNANTLIQAISPNKDVDGLHPLNAGRLFCGLDGPVPCTPQGVLLMLREVIPDLTGKHALVIGRSLLFGKPMAQLLLAENCTVTHAHSKTVDLPGHCRRADILIAAIGRPRFIKGDWIKPGAVVIDVGINRLDDGSLAGDVDFDEAVKVAGAITPVPGGVGPMTIACLLKNTLEAAGPYF